MLSDRVEEWIRRWNLEVERFAETEGCRLVFGRRGPDPVVLKVLKRGDHEWHCGEILAAFNGQGMVRVYEVAPGAALLERVSPGNSLIDMVLSGRDEEATEIVAEVIGHMAPGPPPRRAVAVQDLAIAFQHDLERGRGQIPRPLVERARDVYLSLCASQSRPRLLHGDLHQSNILFDRARGWLAVDPKGVIGEIEYEIGAALRNPHERPDLFAVPRVIEKRLRWFETRLHLDSTRALAWGFAQAVLAAVWLVEDGFDVDHRHPFLRLAGAIEPMLPVSSWAR